MGVRAAVSALPSSCPPSCPPSCLPSISHCSACSSSQSVHASSCASARRTPPICAPAVPLKKASTCAHCSSRSAHAASARNRDVRDADRAAATAGKAAVCETSHGNAVVGWFGCVPGDREMASPTYSSSISNCSARYSHTSSCPEKEPSSSFRSSASNFHDGSGLRVHAWA
eukprot:2376016-Pleurochrysis_carterae.AAC.1